MSEPSQLSADGNEEHEENSCSSDEGREKSTASTSDDLQGEIPENDEEPYLAEQIDDEKQKFDADKHLTFDLNDTLGSNNQKKDDELWRGQYSSHSPIVIPAREPPMLMRRQDDQVNNIVAPLSPPSGNESRTESRTGTEVVQRPVVEFVTPSPRHGEGDSNNFSSEEQNSHSDVRSRPSLPQGVELEPTLSAVLAEDVEIETEPEVPVAFPATDSVVVLNENGRAQYFVSVPENGVRSQDYLQGLNRKTLLCFFVVLIVAVVVTVMVVFATVKKNSPGSFPAEETETWKIVERLVAPLSGQDVLNDVMSPQYRALSWMAEQHVNAIHALNEERIIQRYALGVLYFATGGEEWLQNLRFLSNENECKWKGASAGHLRGVLGCDPRGRVVDLKLDTNSLVGTIPKEVGFLTSLTRLQIDVNFIEGTITSSIGQLKSLKVLNLANNTILGTLPKEVGQLSMLSEMRIENNNLSGLVPSTIGKLDRLRTLDLSNNQELRGTIPSSFANLHLENARIGGTNITGNATYLCGAVKGKIGLDCSKVVCFCKEKCVCVTKDGRKKEVASYVSIKSSLDKNYCLNVKGGRLHPYTRLELRGCIGSPSQKFYFRHNQIRLFLSEDMCVEMDPDIVFIHESCIDSWVIRLDGSLLNVQADACVAVKDSKIRPAAPIVREECDGTTNQTWFFDDKPPYVELKSRLDRSLCLEVEGGNVKDKTRLVLWPCDGSPEQQFHLDGDGRLRTKVRPDACVKSHDEFGLFIHSECVDIWELWPRDGAVRKISDERCISVKDFSARAGNPVVAEDCTGADNQMWMY